MATKAPNLECRMYEAKLPEVDTPVMIRVNNIGDVCTYVSLLEYNNIEGMILLSDLSRRRVRSVGSLIKVGRIEPAMVLRVNPEKGYIDLSKRRLSEGDIQVCEERYSKSKLVHSIMQHVAQTVNIDLEDLYIHLGWPLYRKYGHAFEAFKLIVNNPDSVLNSLTREVKEIGRDGKEVTKVVPAISEEVKDVLVKDIRRRMTPQPLNIRAEIEMKCFQFDGVLHIKEAMRKAEAAGTKECPVRIKLVAPPLYVLHAQTLDKVHLGYLEVGVDILVTRASSLTCSLQVKHHIVEGLIGSKKMPLQMFQLQEQGISILNKAIAACTKEIEHYNGKLTVKEAARAVSEREDKRLAEHMAKLYRDNKEVSGDEESEEEDTGLGDVDVESRSSQMTE